MSRLIDITNEIEALIALKEYRIINFMLGKAIEKMPSMRIEKILTYASAGHRVKEHLDVWPKFMEAVKAQFKANKLSDMDFVRLKLHLEETGA